ncbi:MAG: ABC transporter permease subunit [Myxococcota bacterium]|nr:ABC transporter permease subunit [Myxococcota bacterium]
MMWRTVFILEWRILRRDRAVLACLLIFAVMLLAAGLMSGRHDRMVAQGVQQALNDEESRLADLRTKQSQLVASDAPRRSKDPRDPGWMGKVGGVRLAPLPRLPLNAVAVGQSDLQPRLVQLSTAADISAFSEVETPLMGPTRMGTGPFDPAFLFVVLFPLVVIAVTYEVLSGERERGTLAMLLSQPMSQLELVAGKAAARFGLVTATALAFALLSLWLAQVDVFETRAWTAVGLYLAVIFAWAFFWFALAVFVNARGSSSANNALTLVGLWLVLVVVVPGLVQVVLDTVYPPPSQVEMLHEARERAKDVGKEVAVLKGRHDIDTQTKEYGKKLVQAERSLTEREAPLKAEWQRQNQIRTKAIRFAQFLSPAMVVQLALEDIAGTGVLRYTRFDEQLEAFHHTFREFYFGRIEQGRVFGSDDFARIPTFVFREEATANLASRVLLGVLVMLMLGLALVFGSRRGLRTIGRLSN